MKKILLLLIAIFLITPAVLAADLDAPARKVVTIRTEIERGNSAAFDAGLNYKARETLGFINNINTIIEKNTQDNTDTDAFMLGIYFGEWQELDIRFEALRNNLSESTKGYYYQRLKSDLAQSKHYQQKLNISNEELFNLILTSEDQKHKYAN